jgi:Lrp/AsnC family transcriptional regulator
MAILEILQTDCTRPLADIAEQIGLGGTACWRRIQKMEQQGVITRRVALLDASELNVAVTVFAELRTQRHNAQWLADFHTVIGELPEVVECYRMAGNTDYMLRIVVPLDPGGGHQRHQLDLCHGAHQVDHVATAALCQTHLAHNA